jgi:hypothetical protein
MCKLCNRNYNVTVRGFILFWHGNVRPHSVIPSGVLKNYVPSAGFLPLLICLCSQVNCSISSSLSSPCALNGSVRKRRMEECRKHVVVAVCMCACLCLCVCTPHRRSTFFVRTYRYNMTVVNHLFRPSISFARHCNIDGALYIKCNVECFLFQHWK